MFYELHDCGGGGNHFGERGEIENCVERHEFVTRLQSAVAVGFAVDDLAVVPYDENCTGDCALLDGLLDDGVDGGEMNCGSGVLGVRDGRGSAGEADKQGEKEKGMGRTGR